MRLRYILTAHTGVQDSLRDVGSGHVRLCDLLTFSVLHLINYCSNLYQQTGSSGTSIEHLSNRILLPDRSTLQGQHDTLVHHALCHHDA